MTVLRVLLREFTTRERCVRIPEPEAMAGDGSVEDFEWAEQDDGIIAAPNLFHIAQICEVVSPGGKVVDLGCGPANLLTRLARLNPESSFLGLELSNMILREAQKNLAAAELPNINLRQQDFTDLSFLRDGTVDSVISTMTLHHLADLPALERTFREIGRVLKEDGGVYLTDFSCLKSVRSMEDLANMHIDRQSPGFTKDYLNSMRAAFRREEIESLCTECLGPNVRFYSTFLVPHLIAIKRHVRDSLPEVTRAGLEEMRRRLSPDEQQDLLEIKRFFRLGGLNCPFL